MSHMHSLEKPYLRIRAIVADGHIDVVAVARSPALVDHVCDDLAWGLGQGGLSEGRPGRQSQHILEILLVEGGGHSPRGMDNVDQRRLWNHQRPRVCCNHIVGALVGGDYSDLVLVLQVVDRDGLSWSNINALS